MSSLARGPVKAEVLQGPTWLQSQGLHVRGEALGVAGRACGPMPGLAGCRGNMAGLPLIEEIYVARFSQVCGAERQTCKSGLRLLS